MKKKLLSILMPLTELKELPNHGSLHSLTEELYKTPLLKLGPVKPKMLKLLRMHSLSELKPTLKLN